MADLPGTILPSPPDYPALRPFFGWLPAACIKDTLKVTMQWYNTEGWLPLHCHFKTRFPAANVDWLNEVDATDTFFSDTPALDDGITGHGGCTMVQL